jgi:hypothetical protein
MTVNVLASLLTLLNSFKAEPATVHWRLNDSEELEKLTNQLKLVRPPLEAGLSISPEDGEDTIHVKKCKHHTLLAAFAEVVPLTPADLEDPLLVWSGRNGWLREYNKMGTRLDLERRGSHSESSEDYDSDYIYDDIHPPGQRRASCTVNLDACAFEED